MVRKDFAPAVMSIVLFLGIIATASVRYWRGANLWTDYPVNLDVVFTALYVCWLMVEAPIAGKDVNPEGNCTPDCATCQIYGFAQALTILSALWLPSAWHAPNPAHWGGIALFSVGVSYRLWAIKTLGVLYSHRVRKAAQHRIVDSGPYRFTRHPAYAGMIIANGGVALYFLNGVTLIVYLLALVPAIVLRILVEERMLFGIDGYSEFAKSRNRLFPGIW
ncbi:MAG: isoprenylcysteine carboxylmethyltransferase family protein [Syntrophobacteraceae bacterium]